jgi:Rieske Fe-S protein
MECNITTSGQRKFYCAATRDGSTEPAGTSGPPPKPLEIFDITVEGDKLIIAKKGVKVELPKA